MTQLTYPITVTGIEYPAAEAIKPPPYGGKIGDFVSIRPCDPACEGKTFLGILIGDVALNTMVSFIPETGKLTVKKAFYNPGILVPDLGRVIYGVESWWGVIRSPDDLRKITDLDIDNVWYVKALKQLAVKEPVAAEPEPTHE